MTHLKVHDLVGEICYPVLRGATVGWKAVQKEADLPSRGHEAEVMLLYEARYLVGCNFGPTPTASAECCALAESSHSLWVPL
eukprot:2625323-Amphidinium_carterae.1